MADFSVIGQRVIRKDALDKVLGTAMYSGDIKMPGMLYAKVFRSPIAHGYLRGLNIEKAKTMPGVTGVFTASDIGGINGVGIILKDEPVLMPIGQKIKRFGDPLAVVVAETERQAEEATRVIEAQIEELPAIFDPDEAMKPDAIKINENGNIMAAKKIIKGDIEAGFAKSDIIIEDDYTTSFQEHSYIEPEAGVAYMDGDILTMKISTQNTHFDRGMVARALGLNLNKVRVIQATTGGGFGGKLDISVQCVLGLCALKTKRPVKLVYTREESMLTTSKRHPYIMHYKTGVSKDGKLQALQVRIVADTGAYASYGPGVLTRGIVHASGPYEIPNIYVEGFLVVTNNPMAGAMRGFGVPQVAFAHETQMDRLAEQLGMDPIEFRLLNCLKVGSTTATGQRLDCSVGISQTLIRAREKYQELYKVEKRG